MVPSETSERSCVAAREKTKTSMCKNIYLFLWLIKHHAMKTYVGIDLENNVFLTSTLDGNKWVTSRIFCFIFEETTCVSLWVGV